MRRVNWVDLSGYGGQRQGKGMIIFTNGKRTVSLPLVNVPVLGRPWFVSPPPAATHMSATTAGAVPHRAAPEQIAFIHALACWGRRL